MMMMDQAHFGEYLLRQQMLHAASLSSLRELSYFFIFYKIPILMNKSLFRLIM